MFSFRSFFIYIQFSQRAVNKATVSLCQLMGILQLLGKKTNLNVRWHLNNLRREVGSLHKQFYRFWIKHDSFLFVCFGCIDGRATNKVEVMLVSDAGEKSTLLPTVWYFQQMSLFTELKACVHLRGREYPSSSFSNHRYAWFPFILWEKEKKIQVLQINYPHFTLNSAVQAL